jgi:hypothetical protein
LAFHSGHDADHSLPSSSEVEEWVELYIYSPNTPSWRGAQLGGAQGQLYLALLFLYAHYFNRFNLIRGSMHLEVPPFVILYE